MVEPMLRLTSASLLLRPFWKMRAPACLHDRCMLSTGSAKHKARSAADAGSLMKQLARRTGWSCSHAAALRRFTLHQASTDPTCICLTFHEWGRAHDLRPGLSAPQHLSLWGMLEEAVLHRLHCLPIWQRRIQFARYDFTVRQGRTI